MEWLLGAAGALLLGFVTNLVYDLVKHRGSRLPWTARVRRRLTAQARAHDFQEDGLFALVTWSAARPLRRARLRTTYRADAPRDHLFDDDGWRAEVAAQEAAGAYGNTAYLSRLTVDHGEHEDARFCEMEIAQSSYAECMATMSYASSRPEAGRALKEALERGVHEFVPRVPPTMLSVCVAVVDENDRMLLLRRSLAVRTFQAQWTVGINETMKYNDEPGASEDLLFLVARGLQEELGVAPSEYGPIAVSWLGWSTPASCFCAVASVRIRLDRAEIDARRQDCHSVYEHDMSAWIPLSPATVSRVITGAPCPDGSTRWSYLAPLVAHELLRSRPLL